jgi:hydrogenase-1 operon protein HyaE
MSDFAQASPASGAAVKPAAPAHALLRQLVTQHGGQWVEVATLDTWKDAAAGDAVLLIPGDPVRFPEGLDVAVVLPQLRTAAGKPLRIGVATPTDEDALGQRFGAQRRPSMVFLRDGRYVTVVAGMHDWGAFVGLVQEALSLPTTHAPIAIAAAGAPGASCH